MTETPENQGPMGTTGVGPYFVIKKSNVKALSETILGVQLQTEVLVLVPKYPAQLQDQWSC